jgi:hypothetical protein
MFRGISRYQALPSDGWLDRLASEKLTMAPSFFPRRGGIELVTS